MRETNQIQVAMASTSSEEAAGFVNAVVRAYIDYAQDVRDRDAKLRRRSLESVENEAKNEVNLKRKAQEQLLEKLGNTVLVEAKDLNRFSAEAYGQLNQELVKERIDRIELQGQLDVLRGERPGAGRAPDPRDLENAIAAAFYADPYVHPVVEKRANYQQKMSEVNRKARNARQRLSAYRHSTRRSVDSAHKTLSWTASGTPWNRSSAVDSPMGPETPTPTVSLPRPSGRSRPWSRGNRPSRTSSIRMTLRERPGRKRRCSRWGLPRAICCGPSKSSARCRRTCGSSISSRGAQPASHPARDFEARPMMRPELQPPAATRWSRAGRHVVRGARAPGPGRDLRPGWFGDPEELSSRSRLQVLGVVPPLPCIRPSGGRAPLRQDARGLRRELEEFVQSLDHLACVAVRLGLIPGDATATAWPDHEPRAAAKE